MSVCIAELYILSITNVLNSTEATTKIHTNGISGNTKMSSVFCILEWIMHDKAEIKVDNVTHSIAYCHLKTISFATFAKVFHKQDQTRIGFIKAFIFLLREQISLYIVERLRKFKELLHE